jgi:hypothetical protein
VVVSGHWNAGSGTFAQSSRGCINDVKSMMTQKVPPG